MSGENILIADDSTDIRATLADYLKSLGYRVQTAPDGQKAIALLGAQPLDLVITDLQMPHVDGLGVLQAVKAHDADLPVIILTGHPTVESAVDALRRGAYNYLFKPVENLDEMRHVVEHALAHRRLTLENRRLVEELRALNASLAERVAQQTQKLREAYEQLESLDQLKAQFVSVTSHELRTPLTQWFLAAELLKEQLERGTTTAAKEYLAEMILQGQRLQRLIDNLLDFSLMERGEFELAVGTCHLPDLLRATLDLWRPRLKEKGLGLETAVPERDLVLTADGPRLQNAIGQLLDNAVKFTPAGGRISVGMYGPTRAPWAKAPAQWVVIAIKDSGPGIPLDQQQAVFQAFTQADMSDQRHFGGLGIGLKIAAWIISAHGGRITLKSEKGQGSTFAAWLPVRVHTAPFVTAA